MHKNEISRFLNKPREAYTKKDLINFIAQNNIQMLNFRYLAGDGKLKTLNFVVNSKEQLDLILSKGERVDGSSLFSYIDAASSDLYVVPRYKTAFVNPFTKVPTVDILCSYYTNTGEPLASSPENIIRNAHTSLQKATGYSFEAMGELEYYVFYDKSGLYNAVQQKGYHESAPFAKWDHLRCEAMMAITAAGGQIKYGHSEVGYIQGANQDYEQHEIEFLPTDPVDAADQLVIAKWILRMLGYKYGVSISFAPKIVLGHAGSGLHIHTRLTKDGKSQMIENGSLSSSAKKAIAGYLSLAPSLTAFGNTVPVSFLRLVPHQEAPTNICWGDRNRSVLVRVPLGWTGDKVQEMAVHANPQDKEAKLDTISENQTVEFRCPDGSANIHFLLAGLIVAAREGLTRDDALEIASKLYVDKNIFHNKDNSNLPQLPTSCVAAAESLLNDREIYEKDGVFSASVIEGIANILKSFKEKEVNIRAPQNDEVIKQLIDTYMHCA